MHKTATVLAILAFLSLAVLPVVAIAAEESITLTTYYPSPYGVYKNLRINPNQDAQQELNDSCNENQEGTLSYYKSEVSTDWANAVLLSCLPDKTSTTKAYMWQPVGGSIIPEPGGGEMYIGGAEGSSYTIPFNDANTTIGLPFNGDRVPDDVDPDCDVAGTACFVAFGQFIPVALRPRTYYNGSALNVNMRGFTKSDYIEEGHSWLTVTEKVYLDGICYRHPPGLGTTWRCDIIRGSEDWDKVYAWLLKGFDFPERLVKLSWKNGGSTLLWEAVTDSDGILNGVVTKTEMLLSRQAPYGAYSRNYNHWHPYSLVVTRPAGKTVYNKIFYKAADTDISILTTALPEVDLKLTFTYGVEVKADNYYIDIKRAY